MLDTQMNYLEIIESTWKKKKDKENLKRNHMSVLPLNVGTLFLHHHTTCILDHSHHHHSIFSITVSNQSKLILTGYLHNLLTLHHFEKCYIMCKLMIIDAHHQCLMSCSLNGTSIKVVTSNSNVVNALNINP